MTSKLCGTKAVTDWSKGFTFHDDSVSFLNKLSLEVLTQNNTNMGQTHFRTIKRVQSKGLKFAKNKIIQNMKSVQD